jgi:hypothetical protein
MAKNISQLKVGPVKSMLVSIWKNKRFQKLIIGGNIAGPTGLTYMLAWKVNEQQAQIDELTKRLDQVTRYVGGENND